MGKKEYIMKYIMKKKKRRDNVKVIIVTRHDNIMCYKKVCLDIGRRNVNTLLK